MSRQEISKEKLDKLMADVDAARNQVDALWNNLDDLHTEIADFVAEMAKQDKEPETEVTPGETPKTEYYVEWPKKNANVPEKGIPIPTFAPVVILRTVVGEGETVDAGDIIFILYGGKRKVSRDGGRSGTNSFETFRLEQDDSRKEWDYLANPKERIMGEKSVQVLLGLMASPSLCTDKDWLSNERDNNYKEVPVKAECAGVVHYNNPAYAHDKNTPVAANEFFRSTSLLTGANVSEKGLVCTIDPLK